MSYKKQIEEMTHSFSRLHTYEQCPYQFYLKYIEQRDGESNFYAQNGKAMHEVFEAILNKYITVDEAPKEYMDKYDSIYEEEKQSIMDSKFEKCIDYLCEINPIDEEKYEIIGIELKLSFKVKKYNFIGFADLVVRDRKTGTIILIDHKSSGHFLKKDGTPLKNQIESFNAYKHQMYLYCKGIEDNLNLHVDKIVWHHFCENGILTVIDFKQEEYEETLDWAVNLIEEMKKDDLFDARQAFVMCGSLCDFRNDCEYKEEEL